MVDLPLNRILNDQTTATSSITDAQPSSTQSGGTTTSSQSYTYYHAGALFSLADLHTNVLLSQAIHATSKGRFIPVLPQDLEQRDTTPHSIRDQDLKALLNCDLALITYDGTELDSGTVVEYMVAKMADVPCVILRTDFRGGGDQGVYQSADNVAVKGDPWNLMSSFWPRTKGVVVDGMVEYKTGLDKALKEKQQSGSVSVSERASGLLMNTTATRVVEAMEEVVRMPPRMPKELRESVYTWIGLMPGFKNSHGDEVETKEMLALLGRKEKKGLI